MLSTVASILTGALLVAAPIINNPIDTDTNPPAKSEVAATLHTVSHPINVNTPFDDLEQIKIQAEEAGLGFNYKKRGVKTRLVIDIVIVTGDDYALERMVVREEDGTQLIEWTENENGEAVALQRAEF